MIKFENGMLVLDSTATKEDVDAINEFANYHRNTENKLIKQRLISAMRMYKVIDGAEYTWGMNEIFDIIDGKFTYTPAVYTEDFVGEIPSDAVLIK